MKLRRLLTAAAVGFALVTGCSAEPRLLAAQFRDGADVGDQVFTVGYDRIAEIYLSPVDLGQLTLDGLGALTVFDPSISVERREGVIRLAVDGLRIGEFPAPVATDAPAWAAVTARSVDRLREVSPGLRDVPTEDIHQAVFDGIMADLDGYSRYTGARKAVSERAQREGYGGIGIAIDGRDGRFSVVEVTARTPAARADMRVGDQIVAVDGDLAAYMTLDEVHERLRGPAGSLVLVTLGRAGTPTHRVAVRRERVIPNTVTMTVENSIALIRIDRFNAATTANLREALTSARSPHIPGAGARGFVLDLRGNPGGLLDQAVAVADLFMPRGRIISTVGRHPDSIQRFDATLDDVIGGRPLVVLLDGRSASASEIVAAALQDSGRAIVIGASSYGKGSVQTVTRLPNDGELFLTWSRIYAPSGYTLHLQGVTPTICTSRDQQDALEV
ncbi:MAG TPA: S41 family peptidase, partial [Arenibaculum sp.]|nr:S41 family peptidase [Arenibaculum sp.]